MKTKNPTALSNSVKIALALVLLLISGTAKAEGTNDQLPAVATPSNSSIVSPVMHAGFEKTINNDDGIPLAREDVVPLKTAVSGNSGTTAEDAQLKISGRATNAKMQTFLARSNFNQLQTVFREASQMVDARHVNPPSYEVRTQAAVMGVMMALNNSEFLRANGVNQNTQALQSVQMQLQQVAQTQVARDANQALALMQTVSELVSRGTGIRREAVALEFFNGTMDSLDKYSAFMPEAGNGAPGAMLDTVMTAGLEENIVGVGVELKAHAQGVEIIGVVENSPAAELGLREGDLIVAIAQQNMAGRTLNEVADRLGGAAGSSITVDISRDGQKFRGTMVRRRFYVSSVTGVKIIDPATATGYIRMKQFSESSKVDLEKALFSLHNQGMKNLVFDLRGNPGGLLDVCVEISDMFLTKGVIVSTKGRNASDNTQEVAKFAQTWAVPLVVLVDDNSASASEIFAAAIQENDRGIVVGRTSYGKGTVQTHFPMNSAPAILKLTTAKFYSPNGREMSGSGVTPDVTVNTQVTGYRGTDNDADVQAAKTLINQNAPSMLLSGNLNRNQLNIGQNYNAPNNYNFNNSNYTPNYPNVNPNFPAPGQNYNLSNGWNGAPAFNNGNMNAPNYNNVPNNYNFNSTPNFPAPNQNYNLSNSWNGAPAFNNGNMNAPNFNNVPSNYNFNNTSNFPSHYPRPGMFNPQANQVPAGLNEL
ncbi:S41 family peptidase [Planctomicrobium sp. SH527]|uniref:S41 family peptidase n=1 Tax=Planctomicrobium sp. SH527 TaxID=3448123 RepID=UPI003F5B7745